MTRRVFPNIHYRWWIVMVTFYNSFIYSGGLYFSFSLFVRPLQMEFGWDRATIMVAFSCMFLSFALASPFVGKAVDQYGPKVVMSLGAFITALGFVSLIFISTPIHYYISYIFIGIGGSGIGPIVSTAVVSNWFQEKRGLGIGIMSSGIGVGGMVITSLIGGVIIPNFGWKVAYVSIGVFTSIIIPLAIMVIKTEPNVDLPSGFAKQINGQLNEKKNPAYTINDSTLKEALHSKAFWIIAGSFAFSQFACVGTIQSLVPYLQDIGFPVTTVAFSLGGVGLISAFSKLFFGWLCDKMNPKYAFSIGVSFMAVGTFILMSMGPTSSLSMFWLYTLIMGFSVGSWLPTMSILVSANFGLKSYGAIFGAVMFAFNIGMSTGPLMAGHFYDSTGSYHWAFVAFFILYFLSIPSMLFVKRPKKVE